MSVLPESFSALTFIGLWRPVHYKGWKALFYYLYTLVLFANSLTFIISEAVEMIFFNNGIFDFFNNSSMLITIIGMCGKMITVLHSRNIIIEIKKNLNQYPFKSRDNKENIIKKKFNRVIRFNVLSYASLFEISVVFYTVGKIFEDRPIGVLPCRAWLPFDYSTPIIYWIASAQQLITIIMSCNVDIAYDTFVSGVMLQICLQVKILKHRYQLMLAKLEEIRTSEIYDEKISTVIEKKLFADCVEYHIAILRMVKIVNLIFSKMIFIQYSFSTIILCSSVYAFSQMPAFSPEFIACLVYILCMFFQIFVLCMSGQRVTIEFADLTDTMYNTNWFSLSSHARKYMMMMMVKSSRPIEFVSGYLINLSLESFKRLIKLSYTIYSVLQS
ncbi:hypothetical protein PV327_005910 [Microctonus hyperodae]|uniref:Odorant receptor n=1 Tax=Microctonus hyperodae TaxID=165561 RepID=A0AA39G366_MICHY|nr:hypothetical protein PV327_005910 [Microctonus hyperodae]